MKIKELCDVIEKSVQSRKTNSYGRSRGSNQWAEVPDIILNDFMSYVSQRILSESKKHTGRLPITYTLFDALVKEYDTKIRNILIRVGYPEEHSEKFKNYLFYKVITNTKLFVYGDNASQRSMVLGSNYLKSWYKLRNTFVGIRDGLDNMTDLFDALLLDQQVVDSMNGERLVSFIKERYQVIEDLSKASQKLYVSENMFIIDAAFSKLMKHYVDKLGV